MRYKILKNPLVTGTLVMTMSGVISRSIGFLYRIFLSRTIGAEALGIYQLIGPVFSVCFALTASSIQTSISRFVSDAIGKCANPSCGERQARGYLYLGLLLSCGLTLVTTLVIHHNADAIARILLKDSRCAPLLVLLSYSLFPSSIHACLNGYYYGKKKALVPSLCQLVEQFARVGSVWIIYRVLMERQIPLTAWHAVAGMVIGEFFGLLFVLSAYAFEQRIPIGAYLDMKDSFGMMFVSLGTMVLPLTANRLLVSFSTSLENILIPQRLQTYGYDSSAALSIYGILSGMTLSIIFFPCVLTNSLSVLLLPSVSEAKARNDNGKIQKAMQKALLYGFLAGLVFTILFLFTGDWIGNGLFHNALAACYIKKLSFLCPLLYMTSLFISILNGLGMAKTVLFINLFACLMRIGMIWFLIPQYGMGAYLWSMIMSQIFSAASLVYMGRKAL